MCSTLYLKRVKRKNTYLGLSDKREAQPIVISRFISQIFGASLNFHGSGAGMFVNCKVFER